VPPGAEFGTETAEKLHEQRHLMNVMDHQCQTKSLDLAIAIDRAVTHLTVGGEVDLATADQLEVAGQEALTRPGNSTLVINMTAVRFMSAAGLGALVAINNSAGRCGQVVLLVEASRRVSRIIELTSLTDVFCATGATGATQRHLPSRPPM
jgi:anti-anti-sigma factor